MGLAGCRILPGRLRSPGQDWERFMNIDPLIAAGVSGDLSGALA
jgi:hypothetical protein